jgi:hypothetical protein
LLGPAVERRVEDLHDGAFGERARAAEMSTFASARRAASGGCVALSAGRVVLLAREREGLGFVEVRALTDLCEE